MSRVRTGESDNKAHASSALSSEGDVTGYEKKCPAPAHGRESILQPVIAQEYHDHRRYKSPGPITNRYCWTADQHCRFEGDFGFELLVTEGRRSDCPRESPSRRVRRSAGPDPFRRGAQDPGRRWALTRRGGHFLIVYDWKGLIRRDRWASSMQRPPWSDATLASRTPVFDPASWVHASQCLTMHHFSE